MLQKTSPSSEESKLTDQEQLDLIDIRSRKASQDFINLVNTFRTWYALIDSRDEQAVELDAASPRELCNRELTIITTIELDTLGEDLEYQTEVLIPSPLSNVRQVHHDLVTHKSNIQTLVSEMKLLELRFPQTQELKVQRRDHERHINKVDYYLYDMFDLIRYLAE